MSKFILNVAEFYITNACNLTCVECNRFNNQPFRGHYRFDPNLYAPWVDRINIIEAHVLGGEPTLSPYLLEFLVGIPVLWPDSNRRLVTNGTKLSKHKSLHNVCSQHNWSIEISLHNIDHLKIIYDEITKTFGVPVSKKSITPYPEMVNRVVEVFGDYEPSTFEVIPGTLVSLTTSQGVEIHIVAGWTFHKNAIKNKLTFEVYNSDPTEAHKICTMRGGHFIEGQLYKCGVVKTLPDMLMQQNLPVDPLMLAYKPLNSDFTYEELHQLKHQHIPQCKFCSDNPNDWQAKLPTDSHIKHKTVVIKKSS